MIILKVMGAIWGILVVFLLGIVSYKLFNDDKVNDKFIELLFKTVLSYSFLYASIYIIVYIINIFIGGK